MTTATPTFSPPESVTIPGEVALEALSLLDAFANLLAGFRLDQECDPFYRIENTAWLALIEALGHEQGADLFGPVPDAMYARSGELQQTIRSQLDWPALSAIATSKMARELSDMKARLELIGYA